MDHNSWFYVQSINIFINLRFILFVISALCHKVIFSIGFKFSELHCSRQ